MANHAYLTVVSYIIDGKIIWGKLSETYEVELSVSSQSTDTLFIGFDRN